MGRRGGVVEKGEEEMGAKEGRGGKGGRVEGQKERVGGGLKRVRVEEKGEVEKVKGVTKGYGGLKRGNARLWQH